MSSVLSILTGEFPLGRSFSSRCLQREIHSSFSNNGIAEGRKETTMRREGNLFLILIIVSVQWIFSSAQNLSPLSATFEVKSIQVASTPMNFAVFRMEYNQSLFIPQATNCPPFNPSNAPTSNATCLCDYSSKTSCSTCSECDAAKCETIQKNGWKALGNGVSEQIDMKKSEVLTLLFHVPVFGSAFDVRAEMSYGKISMFMSREIESENSNQWFSYAPGSLFILGCPSQPEYNVGTYFIRIFSHYSDSSFRITARRVPLPSPPTAAERSNELACVDDDNHQCIFDGIPQRMSVNEAGFQVYYKYNFTGCKTIGMGLYTQFGADADVYASDSYTEPYEDTAQIWSYRTGADQDTFRVCSSPGQYKLLFITVDCWAPDSNGVLNFTLSLNVRHSTQSLRMIPFGDILYRDAPHFMSSALSVSKSDGEQYYCGDFAYPKILWPMYPSSSSVPFYPVAPILSLQNIRKEFVTPPLNDRLFTFAILLNVTTTDTQVNMLESDLASLTIYMHWKIMVSSGASLSANLTATPLSSSCDSDEFSVIQNNISTIAEKENNALTSDEIESLEFQLSVIQFSDDYIGCSALLNRFVTSFSGTEVKNSTACVTSRSDNNFNYDPCCSELGKRYDSCEPRPLEVQVVNQKVNQQAVANSQCQSKGCITSLLEDYETAQSEGSCPSITPLDSTVSKYNELRACKDKFYTSPTSNAITCRIDSDCIVWNTTCNLQTMLCKVNKTKQDENFIRCLVNTGESGQLQAGISLLGLPIETSVEKFISAVLQNVTSQSCFDPSNGGISSSQKIWQLHADAVSANCPKQYCEDNSCEVEENTCWTWKRGWYWSPDFQMDQQSCDALKVPNWNKTLCDSKSLDSCEQNDVNPSLGQFFCGHSEDGNTFQEIGAVSAQSQCESTTICIVPQGRGVQLISNLTAEDCNSQFGCTEDYDSSSLTPKETCESSGRCSFNNFLIDSDGNMRSGACKVNRSLPLIGSGVETFFFGPYCQLEQVSIPSACLDFALNETACKESKGEWVTPITNKLECEREQGCLQTLLSDEKSITFYGTTNAFSFQKNPQTCANAGGIWKNFYEWNGGRWINGTSRNNATWQEREFRSYNIYSNAVDFYKTQLLYSLVVAAENAANALSAAVCHRSLSESFLTTVACGCGSNSKSNCFDNLDSRIPVAVYRLCSGVPLSAVASNSTIDFYSTSLTSGCSDIIISTYSALSFRGQISRSLSSNFLTFDREVSFGIYNDNGAAVGELRGNGLSFSSSLPLSQPIQVCLTLRDLQGSDNPAFDVYDFAVVKDQTLSPINANVSLSSGRLCGVISSQNANSGVFPISRRSNWNTISLSESLDRTSFILSNLLGTLFSIIGIACIISIVSAIVFAVTRNVKWLLTDTVMVFMGVFIIIRGVYFFIIPYTIAGSAADYVLSSIPTFLYFTAFSLILAFWMATFNMKQKISGSGLIRYGTIIVIVTNVVLYAIFLILVVTYSQIVQISPAQCGRRTEISLSSGQNSQRAIAIVYAVIVSVVSLVFGCGFLYFGISLLNRMRGSTTGNSATRKRMTIMTVIFSISFLLHSPFIIIVAVLSDKPSSIFSFIGLFVTEIFPVAFFLAISNRLRVLANMSVSGASSTKKEVTLQMISHKSAEENN